MLLRWAEFLAHYVAHAPVHVSRSATYHGAISSQPFIPEPFYPSHIPIPTRLCMFPGIGDPYPPEGCPPSSRSNGFQYPRKVMGRIARSRESGRGTEAEISITDSQLKPLSLNNLTPERRGALWRRQRSAESVADHCMRVLSSKTIFQMSSRRIDPCSFCAWPCISRYHILGRKGTRASWVLGGGGCGKI